LTYRGYGQQLGEFSFLGFGCYKGGAISDSRRGKQGGESTMCRGGTFSARRRKVGLNTLLGGIKHKAVSRCYGRGQRRPCSEEKEFNKAEGLALPGLPNAFTLRKFRYGRSSAEVQETTVVLDARVPSICKGKGNCL